MTGEEYLHLTNGDLCKLTEDIETNGITWHKGDIIEVVYRNRYEESIYVKNNSVDFKNRHPYKTLGAIWFLKAMELYKKWNRKGIITSFTHKFMPGDVVWYMKDNKPFKDTIFSVHYRIAEYKTEWFYTVESESALFQDEGLFATKDELLNSLR